MGQAGKQMTRRDIKPAMATYATRVTDRKARMWLEEVEGGGGEEKNNIYKREITDNAEI
jgi:hypothetical protein